MVDGYYVDCLTKGSPKVRNGSFEKPFKTIAEAMKYIEKKRKMKIA
jgi:hypothetical protein